MQWRRGAKPFDAGEFPITLYIKAKRGKGRVDLSLLSYFISLKSEPTWSTLVVYPRHCPSTCSLCLAICPFSLPLSKMTFEMLKTSFKKFGSPDLTRGKKKFDKSRTFHTKIERVSLSRFLSSFGFVPSSLGM